MLHGAATPAALFLALVLVACGERQVTPHEPALSELVPGPVTQGLCLTARLDARRGLVRYRVSNVGEQPFRYTHGHFGDVLEVRRDGDTAWRELTRRPSDYRFVSGMGPTPRDLRVLAPGGFLPRDAYFSVVDQRRFTPNEGVARPGLDVPQVAEEFTLDLLDFVWPVALEGDALELRVVHIHPDWSEMPGLGALTGCRIPSAVFRLEPTGLPPVIRAELDRR